MSAEQIIAIAKSGVGSRYIWGGTCWDPNHRSWRGADCSGFVTKAWQIPQTSPTTACVPHYYTTASFRNSSTHWTHIGRSNLTKGDGLVNSGHMVLYASGDKWGTAEVYEARGSAYGIIHRMKGVDSSYKALHRHSVLNCKAHCEGDTIVDANCGKGNCAAFGSRCVDDALGARCVFALCPARGKTKICLDKSQIANCTDGALHDKGNCAAYGAGCVQDALGARCVFAFCPAQGKTKVCLDKTHIADCTNGALHDKGDCGVFGSWCSMSGTSSARCVSSFCLKDRNDKPEAHDTCLPDGRIARCDNKGGLSDARHCPEGEACVVRDGLGACVDPNAPVPAAEADAGPEPDLGPGVGAYEDAGARAGLVDGVGCDVGGRGGSRTPPPLALLALIALGVVRRRRRGGGGVPGSGSVDPSKLRTAVCGPGSNA